MLSALLAFGVVACGKKGPLTLPDAGLQAVPEKETPALPEDAPAPREETSAPAGAPVNEPVRVPQ